MASLRQVTPLLVFLLYCLSNTRALWLEGPTGLKLSFPNNSDTTHLPYFSHRVFGNKAHAYAKCSTAEKSRKCLLTVARFNNQQLVSNKSCQLDFSIDKGLGLSFLHVSSISNDRVVLAYPNYVEAGGRVSEMHLRLRLVHMDNCKYHDTQIQTQLSDVCTSLLLNLKLDIFHHEDGTFDVFVPEAPCDGARCKYTFNDKAEQIGQPVAYLPKEFHKNFVKIYPFQKSKAYFAFVSDWQRTSKHSNFDDVLSDVVGSQKLLYVDGTKVTEVGIFSFDFKTDQLVVSTSNDRFGFCIQSKANANAIKCMQFDDKNNKKVDVQLDKRGKNPKLLAVYNVEKGLLAVDALCNERTCSGLRIAKVGFNNQIRSDYVDIEKPLSIAYANAEMDSGEFCISTYGPSLDEDNRIAFVKTCTFAAVTNIW